MISLQKWQNSNNELHEMNFLHHCSAVFIDSVKKTASIHHKYRHTKCKIPMNLIHLINKKEHQKTDPENPVFV